MLFFQNTDPLEDFLNIVRQANPDKADLITLDALEVDEVYAVDPAHNNGFNSKVRVRPKMVDAIGVVTLYFNRIELSKAYIDGTVVVEVGTDLTNACLLSKSEVSISNAMGTALTTAGKHPDFLDRALTVQPKQTTAAGITVEKSLRYAPGTVSVLLKSLGVDLTRIVKERSFVPFQYTGAPDKFRYTDENHTSMLQFPNLLSEPKLDWRLLQYGMDFASVFGNDPKIACVENKVDPQNGAFRFTENAFKQINSILEMQGAPKLLNPYIAVQLQYVGVNTGLTSGNLNADKYSEMHRQYLSYFTDHPQIHNCIAYCNNYFTFPFSSGK